MQPQASLTPQQRVIFRACAHCSEACASPAFAFAYIMSNIAVVCMRLCAAYTNQYNVFFASRQAKKRFGVFKTLVNNKLGQNKRLQTLLANAVLFIIIHYIWDWCV